MSLLWEGESFYVQSFLIYYSSIQRVILKGISIQVISPLSFSQFLSYSILSLLIKHISFVSSQATSSPKLCLF